MKYLLTLLLALSSLVSMAQNKVSYLEKNRFDLHDIGFEFPQKDFKIIGFGAYHGSAKIEDVELKLLKNLTQDGTINYYMYEVDYSTARFFNKYLETGDTTLLNELVTYMGYHVPQERTIEMYEKWKRLKKLNDELPKANKLEVLGMEWIMNYKYVSRHLLELVPAPYEEFPAMKAIQEMVQNDTTYYARSATSEAHRKLQKLVSEYEGNKEAYLSKTQAPKMLEYLLRNIQYSFEKRPDREKIVYENYVALDAIHNFKDKPQFLRVGFFHLEKSREGEGAYPSFFTRLIEHDFYKKEEVISVIGYYTNSRVVWDEVYDENGDYASYTTEGGYGIGDYEKEYFRGIEQLKKTKLSDMTLFRLNRANTPYAIKEPDLIEVVMSDDPSNTEAVKGMATIEFLDYAILISDSKASVPIYEMDKDK